MKMIIEEADAIQQEVLTEEQSVKVEVKGGRVYAFCKRAFDVVCSLFGLIVLSWLFLIVAILIKCTSKGPIIYTSERVGKDGKVFKFYKFRSMYQDAESQLEDLLKNNEIEGGVTFKMKNDPRITPIGRFLRKTSIDELPQLWNVLRGDMSIVGPRPGTVREYKLYNEYHMNRLLVPQGLTGEWQVRGRSTTTFEEMIKMDIDYISKKRSFGYDMFLILKTFTVFLSHDSGAE